MNRPRRVSAGPSGVQSNGAPMAREPEPAGWVSARRCLAVEAILGRGETLGDQAAHRVGA